MVSGELAARAALDAMRAGKFDSTQLRGYESAWKSEIGEELSHSVRLQKLLLADPGRIDRIVRAASRHAVFAELLARYATGAISHIQFRRSMLRRALPVYVREKTRRFLHG
jgi:flavin-dependent dehydrogenase